MAGLGGAETTETLRLVLEATNNLTGPLRQATRDLNALQETGKKVAGALGSIGKGLAAGLLGYLGFQAIKRGLEDIVRTTFDLADETQRLAIAMGITTEKASGLAFAMRTFGVNMGDFMWGMQTLAENMVKVASGAAKENPFAQLGISVVDATGKLRSAHDVLLDVADALSRMPDGAPKFAWVQKTLGVWPIFGGDRLIQVLNLGRQGMLELEREAARLGVSFDQQMVAKARTAQIQLALLNASWQGLKVVLGSAILPSLIRVTRALTDLAKSALPVFKWAVDVVGPPLRELLLLFRDIIAIVGQFVGAFLRAAFGENWYSHATKIAVNASQWLTTKLKELRQELNLLAPVAQTTGRILGTAFDVALLPFRVLGDILGGIVRALDDIRQGNYQKALEDLRQGFRNAGKDLDDLDVKLSQFDLYKSLKEKVMNLRQWLNEWPAHVAMWAYDVYLKIKEKVGEWLAPIEDWLNRSRESVRNWFANLPGNIATWAADVYKAIKERASEWLGPIDDWVNNSKVRVQDWFANLPARIAEWSEDVQKTLSEKVQPWVQPFSTWVDDVKKRVGGWIDSWPGTIGNWGDNVKKLLGDKLQEWRQAFTDWVENIKTKLGNGWDDIKVRFENALSQMVEKAKEYGHRIMQALRDAMARVQIPVPKITIQWKTYGSNKLSITVPVPRLDVQWESLADILRLAEGGILTRPTLALLAETPRAQPEVAAPLRDLVGIVRTAVRNEVAIGPAMASVAAGRAGGRGGVTIERIEIHVHGSVHTERSLVDAIKRALYEEARLQTQFAF